MAKPPPPPPAALVLAAQELEDELRRCEEAAAEAARLKLHSEKNISRAARALKTAAEHRDALGGKVNGLLAAIQSARGRADEAAARMEGRAAEIQKRLEQLQALQTRAGEISSAAKELTEFARHAKAPKEILERLGPVEERIAQTLEEARAADFDDVVHDLAALKELLAAMRRKLEGR